MNDVNAREGRTEGFLRPASVPGAFEVAGVDGCKAGWFVAVAGTRIGYLASGACGPLELKRVFVSPTFADVLSQTRDCKLVCVDIPIGLSDGPGPRQCDMEARRLLGGAGASSVFPAPIRPCLSAKDYDSANAISRAATGKGLSKQSFAILGKIREVDEVMTPELQNRVREIHPEILFWALNGGRPMQHNKKTVPGQTERHNLLAEIFPNLDDILTQVPSRGCVLDDVHDAVAAAWTAGQAVLGHFGTLPEKAELDAKGLRMEMLYPRGRYRMSEDWANKIAEDFHRRGLLQKGPCLILGGADTGKTTLVGALCSTLAKNGPVGIVDADIGQSHIGPPTTVGWGVIDGGRCDLSQVEARGIDFVGDITPAGHLLQFTGALLGCVREACEAAKIVVIDTPGFIAGPAASALWWEVQRILSPEVIVAVQREDELGEILGGLKGAGSHIELVSSPDTIRTKSPQERRRHRQRQFAEYLRESSVHEVSLNQVAVQTGRRPGEEGRLGRVVGLRDENGQDVAVGVIERWGQGVVTVRAPKLDIERIRCLVIGDVAIDFGEG